MTRRETPVVRAEAIEKWFGGVQALRGVTFEVHPGEVVGLVGENGAGKSTLVKILSGLLQPDRGRLWFGDVEVSGLTRPQARELGVETVYQHLALCDNLSAAANVMLGQEPVKFSLGPLKIIDKRRRNEETRARLADVGVAVRDVTVPVRRLSGGQRQAIAIARATSTGHRLIMFDEPTAALGVRQRQNTLDVIRRVADQGVGAILISHVMDDVFQCADRVLVLRLGEVVLDVERGSTTREEVVGCMIGVSLTSSAPPSRRASTRG